MLPTVGEFASVSDQVVTCAPAQRRAGAANSFEHLGAHHSFRRDFHVDARLGLLLAG